MPFAHVPGELRKPMQSALRVPQRREHHVGPKPRAVFADSPSFVHALSALGCFRHYLFRLAIHHTFRRTKHGNEGNGTPAQELAEATHRGPTPDARRTI